MNGIQYKIRRTRRKTAAIHVSANGIEVRVPVNTSSLWVEQFVDSKAHWIRKTQTKLAISQPMQQALSWERTLLWNGDGKRLTYQHSTTANIQIGHDALIISAPKKPTLDALRLQLEQLFKNTAKSHLSRLTWSKANQLGVKNDILDIRFRRTKTKWGHCTSQGRIQYNWQIMGAPLAVQDYLVCHEVSHLIHPNHSRAFWQCVAQICPDYEQHRKWLKELGYKLQW